MCVWELFIHFVLPEHTDNYTEPYFSHIHELLLIWELFGNTLTSSVSTLGLCDMGYSCVVAGPLGSPWEHTRDGLAPSRLQLFLHLSSSNRTGTFKDFFFPPWWAQLYLTDEMGYLMTDYSYSPVIKLKTRQRLAVYYIISQGSVYTPTSTRINTSFPL